MTVPPQRIHIRQAVPGDHRCIASLGRETFRDSFAADNHPQDMADYLARSFSPEIQSAELAEPSACFLIAEAGEQAVGSARLVEAPAPSCIAASRLIKLERLYVQQNWFGSGVGAALMRACIDEAQRRPCDDLWLGVWGKNDRTIRFYRQWGFLQMGTRHVRPGQ